MSTTRQIRPPTVSLYPRITPGRRLRIGVVAPPFLTIPPKGYGGIERMVSVLVGGLVAAGHDVTLFAAARSVTRARVVSPLSSTVPLGDPGAPADELYHTTVAYLRAEEFDILHDHTGTGPALGSLLGHHTPVVHTLHGPWTPISRRFLGLVAERVHLVAISQAQRAGNSGVHYAGMVYNGIDLAAHPFRKKKEDFLVFVGRISPEKRPEVAAEVAKRAGMPLVMVVKRSEPAERAYWEQVVAPRLGHDVEVFDEPPEEVKLDIVGRAQAMLFPIDWPEPFGLVMTEAMACGTPVIARAVGAAPEIVADGVTGFLCSSVEEMVESVERTKSLEPEDSRDRVKAYFSAETMVRGYESVYEDVLISSDRSAAGQTWERALPEKTGANGSISGNVA
jgi:glycosyltransferase involved in cell wall biosynthesis